MYVLDTNTLIYFFKGIGNVSKKLLSVSPQQVAIPAVVIYELEYGIAKSTSPKKRTKQLKALTSSITILPFAEPEAKASAQIRAYLEKKGTTISHYDLLIAGTAIANNGTLVTNNTKEFKRISGLNLKNWL